MPRATGARAGSYLSGFTRLRWLRDSVGDPAGCMRMTSVAEFEVAATSLRDGRVKLRVRPLDRAERLAQEFFEGARYKRSEDGEVAIFVGRPA